MSKPLVSIIMPVFNTELYVKEAIESILQQTHANFELLIFNDGSTDNSKKIISSIKDSRIRFFDHADNQGYLPHLNNGLQLAQGKYIARMDSDDISQPARLEKQVNFLEQNPDLDIIGSSIWLFSVNKKKIAIWTYPKEEGEFKARLMSNTCFAHPSILFRRKLVDESRYYYDQEFYPAEDYELWTRLKLQQVKFYCLEEPLLKYRISANQIGNNPVQRIKADKIRRKYIETLIPADKALCNWLVELFEMKESDSLRDRDELKEQLQKVAEYFKNEDAHFKRELARLIFFRVTPFTNRKFNAFSLFKSTKFGEYYNATFRNMIKLSLLEKLKS